MTLSEFNQLSAAKQTDIVLEWGFFIANYKSEGRNHIMFSLSDFFVQLSSTSDNSAPSIITLHKSEMQPGLMDQVRSFDPFKASLIEKNIFSSLEIHLN